MIWASALILALILWERHWVWSLVIISIAAILNLTQ